MEKTKTYIEQLFDILEKKHIYPLILFLYPLIGINQGLSVVDTTYSLSNFRFFDELDGTWMVATYLANVTGNLLMKLPFGDSILFFNFYTGLLVSLLAIINYGVLGRVYSKRAVFVGEMIAICMCWCPTTILYNYLTYFVMGLALICLYQAVVNGYQPGFFIAGILLGTNVMVRMPNVVQMGFILVVWYGAFLYGKTLKDTIRQTLVCIAGYVIGFLVPFCAMSMRFGFDAFGKMVYTMFAMTEKAADYKPTSMLTGMFGDYISGMKWLVLLVICTGFLAVMFAWRREKFRTVKKLVCIGIFALLLRFYWGRGMFHLHYYDYGSVYQWVVLFLWLTLIGCVVIFFAKKSKKEDKCFAAIVFLQIFLTPLGSNNGIYPIMNNLFLAAPFLCVQISKGLVETRNSENRSDILKHVYLLSGLFVIGITLYQGLFFHHNFALQDGVWGEKRTAQVTGYQETRGMYTEPENAKALQEVMDFAKEKELAGKSAIFYGEVPGLGYFLNMPSALSTFWPDLDSYRMEEYVRDMEALKGTPVIVTSAQIASWYEQDEQGMEWFGVEEEVFSADEKLQILSSYMHKNAYSQVFCNGKYAIYE